MAPVTVAGTVCDAVRGAAGRPVGCSGRVSGEATMSDDGLFADPAQPARASFPDTITAAPRFDPNAPLAARMRPRTLDEVIGQQHLLGAGAPLRRLVHGGAPSSMLLYGPPGTGKTTLATLVAGATGRRFAQLSAIAAGVKEVRAVIEQARYSLRSTGEQTVLFIDEVHRFNKAQQDSLLGAVEDRTVILIGATTENPFFSVVSPLLSRSLILQLQPLTDADIVEVLTRAVTDDRGLAGRVTLSDEARDHLVALSGGDARRSLTALEAAADSVLDEHPRASREQPAAVDLRAVERAVNRAAVRYDKSGDQHYDIISAFIKSLRGSDVDAALHYLARMIEAGEDPRFIARRLMVHASEDVGNGRPDRPADRGRRRAGGSDGRHAGGEARAGPGHHPHRHRAEVRRDHLGAGCCDGRRPGRQERVGAAAPARRALPGCREAGQRPHVRLPARPAGRHRAAAVPAGRARRA